MSERRTIRRYAHEMYPHAEEGETRALAVEVPYLYAQAVGLNVWGTGWYDDKNDAGRDRAILRVAQLGAARHMALVADALLQGMAGQEAWEWADLRAWDETGEWVYERAMHYGVPAERIKPYPCLQQSDGYAGALAGFRVKGVICPHGPRAGLHIRQPAPGFASLGAA